MKHTTSALLMAVELALQPSNAQAQKTKGPVDLTDAAFVVVDPQVDFLRSKGATWKLAGKGVRPTTLSRTWRSPSQRQRRTFHICLSALAGYSNSGNPQKRRCTPANRRRHAFRPCGQLGSKYAVSPTRNGSSLSMKAVPISIRAEPSSDLTTSEWLLGGSFKTSSMSCAWISLAMTPPFESKPLSPNEGHLTKRNLRHVKAKEIVSHYRGTCSRARNRTFR